MRDLLSVQTAEAYVGKYYSQDYIRRKVLRQTDEEILEQDKLIETRNQSGHHPRSSRDADRSCNRTTNS